MSFLSAIAAIASLVALAAAVPAAAAGRVLQSAYIVVVDIEAHYERALAAGAVIAMPLKTEDYGGKSYSCWDSEGQLWNFGSYDPWADNPA